MELLLHTYQKRQMRISKLEGTIMKWTLIILSILICSDSFAATLIKMNPRKKLIVLRTQESDSTNYNIGEKVHITGRSSNATFVGKIVGRKKNRIGVRVNRYSARAVKNEIVTIKNLSNPSPSFSGGKRFTGLYLSTNPVALLNTQYGAELGLGIADNFSVGLEGYYSYVSSEFTSVNYTAYMFGGTAGYYFSGYQYDSFYLKIKGGYTVETYEITNATIDLDDSSYFSVTSLICYQWIWDNGLHLNPGVGAKLLLTGLSGAPFSGITSSILSPFYMDGVGYLLPALEINLGFMI